MPLEEVFSQVKAIIKANDNLYVITSIPELMIKLAFATVTPEDTLGYIKHAGYTFWTPTISCFYIDILYMACVLWQKIVTYFSFLIALTRSSFCSLYSSSVRIPWSKRFLSLTSCLKYFPRTLAFFIGENVEDGTHVAVGKVWSCGTNAWHRVLTTVSIPLIMVSLLFSVLECSLGETWHGTAAPAWGLSLSWNNAH